MPIIDFPFYLDAIQMRAAARGSATVIGYETVDGLNLYDGDQRSTIYGTSAVYGNIEVDGVTYLGAYSSSTVSVSATATVVTPLRADIEGTASVEPFISYGDGEGYLPALVSYGSQGIINSALGYLRPIYSVAESWYVPPKLTEGYGVLTGFTSVGLIADPNIGETYLPSLVALGWLTNSVDDPYTASNMVGSGYLPYLGSFGYDGDPLVANLNETFFTFTAFAPEVDLVLVISENMTIADAYLAQRQLLQNYLEQLSGSDTFTYLGAYKASTVEILSLSDFFLATVGAKPGAFTENTTVWVFNTDNSGSTQYDHYGFNSFTKRNAEYLAAAEDGIYVLSGDTDFGQNISAEISLALSRYQTPQKKYFPAVYLGVTCSGKMLLKVNVDGTDWLYEAENSAATMQNQRISIGKGLTGSHWHFTLLNQQGLDFDLESVEFLPMISSRRIY